MQTFVQILHGPTDDTEANQEYNICLEIITFLARPCAREVGIIRGVNRRQKESDMFKKWIERR